MSAKVIDGCLAGGAFASDNSSDYDDDNTPITCSDVNKEYKRCGNQCPKYCNMDPKEVCADYCVSGCFCKEGMVLASSDSSTCIKREQCVKTGAINLRIMKCGPNSQPAVKCGSACPPTCGAIIRTCPAMCAVGCYCNDGFILSLKGTCIPRGTCPKCNRDNNEVWSQCACEPTCCSSTPTTCPPSKCVKGCACRPGYSRLPNGGACKKKCPKC